MPYCAASNPGLPWLYMPYQTDTRAEMCMGSVVYCILIKVSKGAKPNIPKESKYENISTLHRC